MSVVTLGVFDEQDVDVRLYRRWSPTSWSGGLRAISQSGGELLILVIKLLVNALVIK